MQNNIKRKITGLLFSVFAVSAVVLALIFLKIDAILSLFSLDNASVAQLYLALVFVSLIVLVPVYLSISTIINKQLINPILKLTDTVKQIADGKFHDVTPVRFPEELEVLFDNFYRIVEQLSTAKQELDNYIRNLEHVITLRTERLNNTLAELQEQIDFLDKLLCTVATLIIVMDRQGRIVLFNKACQDATGFTEEEVKGKVIWECLIPERFIPIVRITFDELSEGASGNSLKNPLLTKDGREIMVLWNNTVFVENNEIRYIIGTGIDITEKEKIEAYIWDMQRLRSINALTSGLSHNLNNILVSALGYAGLLRVKVSSIQLEDKSEILNYIDFIENSAHRASELIKHLSAFNRRIEYVPEVIAINDIVSEVYEIVRSSFSRRITIELELTQEPAVVKVDKDKVKQALLNILINANEAIGTSGLIRVSTARLELTGSSSIFKKAGKYIAVKISDNGCGMDSETKSHIFEPFFTTKGMLEHTGLGLTIAYNTIKDHDGYIMVDTELGKGSVFTVYIPEAT